VRIAHINAAAASDTGRVAVQLCRMAQQAGHKALLCHAYDYAPTDVSSYRIGTRIFSLKRASSAKGTLRRFVATQKDRLRCRLNTDSHLFFARLTDRSGFFSKRATRRLVEQLDLFKPDLIHLHTLHGYYLHLPTLFEYLKTNDMPVVWTLQDCWPFTGHCACYAAASGAVPVNVIKRRRAQQPTTGCDRWQAGCGKCVLKRSYPASLFFDRSSKNWAEKRKMFQGLGHMVLTAPSEWLRDEISLSFLKNYPVYVFPGGVDTKVFTPCTNEDYRNRAARAYGLDELGGRKLVLSTANIWDEQQGLEDLMELAEKLGPEYCVAAVGLDKRQLKNLPDEPLMGIGRPGNLNDLCALYTLADVYVSASRGGAFGPQLLEAMACGTQVVCYDAEALPEVITDEVGETVAPGDVDALADAVRRLCGHPKEQQDCLARAAAFDLQDRFAAYMRLYEKIYHFSPAYQNALDRAAGKGGTQNE